MGVNTVDFLKNGTVDQNRAFSPAVWGDCPIADIQEGALDGYFIDDDFVDFPLIGTQTTQIAHGRYKVFNTGSGTVVPVSVVNSVEMGGNILQISLDTDNDSGAIAQSYPSFMLTGLASNSGKLWFEARVAVNTLLTDTIGFFVGLAEVEQWTLATAVPFNGASATINNSASALGFYKGEDALGVVDVSRSDRATGWTQVKAAAGTFSAAFTFMKVGIVYDPTLTDRCIKFFVDNVEQTTYITRTALQALTNFDANAHGLIAAAVADTAGTTSAFFMDRWRCYQLAPTA